MKIGDVFWYVHNFETYLVIGKNNSKIQIVLLYYNYEELVGNIYEYEESFFMNNENYKFLPINRLF